MGLARELLIFFILEGMNSVFGYANYLICVDSIHFMCLAPEVLWLGQRFLTRSKRQRVSKQMLSSPGAEQTLAPCSPLLWMLQSCPKVFFFSTEHTLLMEIYISSSSSVSQGAAAKCGALRTGATMLFIYCCFPI